MYGDEGVDPRWGRRAIEMPSKPPQIVAPSISHSTTPSRPVTVFWWKLSQELRDMIYDLCLIKDDAIPICSPRRKYAINKEFTSPNLAVLLRINKRFNYEASLRFYSQNTWVIGNGDCFSPIKTNPQALQKFYQRVPISSRMHIKNVIFEIHSRESRSGYNHNSPPSHFSVPYSIWRGTRGPATLGTALQSKSLLTVSRALVKHFPGVENIAFRINHDGPYHPISWDNSPHLTKTESTKVLAKVLTILSNCKNANEIGLVREDNIDMKAALEMVIKKSPQIFSNWSKET